MKQGRSPTPEDIIVKINFPNSVMVQTKVRIKSPLVYLQV